MFQLYLLWRKRTRVGEGKSSRGTAFREEGMSWFVSQLEWSGGTRPIFQVEHQFPGARNLFWMLVPHLWHGTSHTVSTLLHAEWKMGPCLKEGHLVQYSILVPYFLNVILLVSLLLVTRGWEEGSRNEGGQHDPPGKLQVWTMHAMTFFFQCVFSDHFVRWPKRYFY